MLTSDHEWTRMLSVDYNCTLALLPPLLKNAILPVLHTLSTVILIILHSTSTRMRRFEVGVAVIIGHNNKSEAMATKLNSLSLSHITTSCTVTD